MKQWSTRTGSPGRFERGTADHPWSAVVISAKAERQTRLVEALHEPPHSFRVYAARRPREALEYLAAGRRADVLVLDLDLPGTLAWQFLEEVVSRPIRPAVVAILPDGWAEPDDDLPCRVLESGAEEVVPGLEFPAWWIQHQVLAAVLRREAARRQEEIEGQFSLIMAGSSDGAWLWNIKEQRAWFSPRWRELLGLDAMHGEESIETWLDRVHPADADAVEAALEEHLTGRSQVFELEHRLKDRRGEYRWMVVRGVAARDSGGRAELMGGSMADITARRWAEQQLLHDAFHDPLTGLPNRPLFLDRLALALSDTGRSDARTPAVIVLDLDRFREINEELGPGAGDDLLIAVGIRIQKALRPEDTVARLGSDEFGILIPHVHGTSEAVKVIDRIGEALERPVSAGGRELHVQVTFGLVLAEGENRGRPEDILRNAEVALYRARGNRSRFEIFDPEMQRAAVSLLKMRSELKRGLEQGEFEMFYQPIVSLESGRITGFEGLVRWNHPDRGLLTPYQFIGLAEETGLIVPLGWWVLERACDQLRVWQEGFPCEPPLTMSVNVSGRIMLDRRMAERLFNLLERSGVAPESLRLEVTERAVWENERRALEQLGELRAMGVRIAVDDFGVGYSSLAQLYRFDFDELKIDRSLVAALGQDPRAAEMIEAILTLARSLRIDVVSEGVETADQLHMLRGMKCPSGQGFWFSRPAKPESITELLGQGPLW